MKTEFRLIQYPYNNSEYHLEIWKYNKKYNKERRVFCSRHINTPIGGWRTPMYSSSGDWEEIPISEYYANKLITEFLEDKFLRDL